MFKRLRGFFDGKPRVGDLVTVLSGPYAGKSGTINAIDGQLSTIYIDECCRPKLAHDAFEREWRGRNMHLTARRARESDEEAEMARYILQQHDQNNSL
jgi:ribosomal protein L24